MILATLPEADRYAALHPGFGAAFTFIKEHAGGILIDGKHIIEGEELFAIVSSGAGRGKEASPLEVHRRYIDIQYVIEGKDRIGWKPLARCSRKRGQFDAAKDIGFYEDTPDQWMDLPAGAFAVFFPEDAHAPLAGNGKVRKIVLKVLVRE